MRFPRGKPMIWAGAQCQKDTNNIYQIVLLQKKSYFREESKISCNFIRGKEKVKKVKIMSERIESKPKTTKDLSFQIDGCDLERQILDSWAREKCA